MFVSLETSIVVAISTTLKSSVVFKMSVAEFRYVTQRMSLTHGCRNDCVIHRGTCMHSAFGRGRRPTVMHV